MSDHYSTSRVALVALGFVLSSAIASAQRPGAQLSSKPVDSFDETANTVSDLLARLANNYQVPVGLEAIAESTRSAKAPPIRVSVKSGAVRDVLDAVVTAESDYAWQEVDGVINVAPRQHVDSLLDVVIGRFEVNEIGKNEALEKLTSTPEVRSWLARTGLRERSFVGGVVGSSPQVSGAPKRISLNMANCSVRTILNQMMKISGSYEWVYFRYGPDDRLFSLAM